MNIVFPKSLEERLKIHSEHTITFFLGLSLRNTIEFSCRCWWQVKDLEEEYRAGAEQSPPHPPAEDQSVTPGTRKIPHCDTNAFYHSREFCRWESIDLLSVQSIWLSWYLLNRVPSRIASLPSSRSLFVHLGVTVMIMMLAAMIFVLIIYWALTVCQHYINNFMCVITFQFHKTFL